jgi:magnesium chelatase subunit H
MNFVRAHALAHAGRWAATSRRRPARLLERRRRLWLERQRAGGQLGLRRRGRTGRRLRGAQVLRLRRNGKASANAALLQRALKEVDVAYQNLESVELGVTTVDHYFDTLGGIARAVKRARGEDAAIYIGDQTRGAAKVRTLQGPGRAGDPHAQPQPEVVRGDAQARPRGRAPDRGAADEHDGLVGHHRQVEPWVYQRMSETFVLDAEMRKRLAA